MQKSDSDIERVEKIKKWLKKPENLTLIAILLFAAIIRIHFTISVVGQPLWWDEAEYGSAAKKWVYGISYDLWPGRPPLFQFLWSILIQMSFSEQAIKFLLVVFPSIFLVFATYLLGKEMFNERVGLIAAFLTSVSWTFLFWTIRFQPDFFSMSFQVLSVYFMWKYWRNDNAATSFVIFSAVFAFLGLQFKISALLVPLTFMIFILIKDRLSAFKNKDYYLFALTFFILLIPYFIWSHYEFGNWRGLFSSGYSNQVVNPTLPFAWYTLNFFYLLTEEILFFLFLAGIVLGMRFFLYIDVAIKEKKKMLDPSFFGILVLVIVTFFYVFYIRGAEDRWVFLWLPFIFFFIGNFLIFLYNSIKKYQKFFALIIILSLLAYGGYAQYDHANKLIENKKESYMPVKLAGEWLKANTDKQSIVLTQSITQITYYAEKKSVSFSNFNNSSDLDKFIEDGKSDLFAIVSIFEHHPPWVQEWVQKNQERLVPIQAYFADAQKTQAVLIIYQVKKNGKNN